VKVRNSLPRQEAQVKMQLRLREAIPLYGFLKDQRVRLTQGKPLDQPIQIEFGSGTKL